MNCVYSDYLLVARRLRVIADCKEGFSDFNRTLYNLGIDPFLNNSLFAHTRVKIEKLRGESHFDGLLGYFLYKAHLKFKNSLFINFVRLLDKYKTQPYSLTFFDGLELGLEFYYVLNGYPRKYCVNSVKTNINRDKLMYKRYILKRTNISSLFERDVTSERKKNIRSTRRERNFQSYR